MFFTNGSDIEIKPVSKENWGDFENFFASNGRLNHCWCMAWRMTKEELKTNTAECRKAFIKKRVWAGIPIGILAYFGGRPVAWCSIAPRETHQGLKGDDSIKNVWSITCFYIVREFRRKGFVHLLIDSAKAYAMDSGAKFLEAYPVDPDSPSYRFMGFVSTFIKKGFRYVKDAGTRRHVMVLSCDCENSGLRGI